VGGGGGDGGLGLLQWRNWVNKKKKGILWEKIRRKEEGLSGGEKGEGGKKAVYPLGTSYKATFVTLKRERARGEKGEFRRSGGGSLNSSLYGQHEWISGVGSLHIDLGGGDRMVWGHWRFTGCVEGRGGGKGCWKEGVLINLSDCQGRGEKGELGFGGSGVLLVGLCLFLRGRKKGVEYGFRLKGVGTGIIMDECERLLREREVIELGELGLTEGRRGHYVRGKGRNTRCRGQGFVLLGGHPRVN